jgi:hypothetical protein
VYQHSDEFVRRLADPDLYRSRVYSALDALADPVEITDYLIGGSLTVGRQEIRTSGQLSFVNELAEMLPVDDPDHPLGPYGQELLIHRGVQYADPVTGKTVEELIPQGPLRVTAVDATGPTVQVQCYDRAWRIKRAKNETAYTIAANTVVTDAIVTVLETAWPEIQLAVVPTTERTPTVIVDAFTDPWQLALKLAASIGYALYFDRDGVCQLRPERDNVDTVPVWSYDDASLQFIPRTAEHWANLGLPTIGVNWDTEDTYNVWIVRGENSENASPFQGIYRHIDPNSPLRWNSRFGPSVSSTVDPNVTSDSMARAAAAAKASRELGVAEAVKVDAILNPALEIDDTIKIVKRNLWLNQLHLVDSYTVPLIGSGQAIGTRRRAVVFIGD